jgi:hypothetical protein
MLNLESCWIQGVGSSGIAADLVNDFELVLWIQFCVYLVLRQLGTI